MQMISPSKNLRSWLIVLIVMFCLLSLNGCAGHHNSTRTVTTTETYQDENVQSQDDDTTKTVVTTEESSASARTSDGGIFGGVFHLVGEVLAFPFRVIASVFDALF